MNKETYRKCSFCRYLINNSEFSQLRLDYDCPRCRQKKMSEFVLTDNPFSAMVTIPNNPNKE